MSLNNNKKTVSKSQLIQSLNKAQVSTTITYDLHTDKDKKDCIKDIENYSKKERVSVVVIIHK